MCSDYNKVWVTTHEPPDKLGRQMFTLEWLANNIGVMCNETGVRGQVYFAVLEDMIKGHRGKGKEIIIKFDAWQKQRKKIGAGLVRAQAPKRN